MNIPLIKRRRTITATAVAPLLSVVDARPLTLRNVGIIFPGLIDLSLKLTKLNLAYASLLVEIV